MQPPASGPTDVPDGIGGNPAQVVQTTNDGEPAFTRIQPQSPGGSAPDGVNQVWVGDITYVPLVGGKFVYLALLMDLFSRRIIGSALRGHMRESLVLEALRASITTRQPTAGFIHHSDRGGQYAGGDYRRMLSRARARQSMSRADNCYDNAFMESCFGTVKTEMEIKPYENLTIARKEIPAYIRYYNTRRRHSSLDYLTPEAFEEASKDG